MTFPARGTAAWALREAVEGAGAQVFLRYGDEAITFAELDERSDRLATGLARLGYRRGDRIGLAALNQPEWLDVFFAAQKLGLAVVTLNVRYREAELCYMLNQSGARGLVCLARLPDFDFQALFASLGDRLPALSHHAFIGEASYAELAATPADPGLLAEAAAQLDPSDPAIVLYTSGTTGQPKGAVITNRSLLASARAQVEHFGLRASDVAIGTMPLNHVGGITCTVSTALLTASSVVLLPAFDPVGTLAAIDAHRATVFGGVPTMYLLMLSHPDFARYDVSSLRYAIAGGSNVEPELCERIAAGFPNARLANLYGLSESSGACVLSASSDDVAAVARSIGVVVDGFEGRVTGLDGAVLPAGEIGELQVRGECVAAGYWEMPEQSAETFLPGGWLATGDMALLEPDGHVVLKGRRKEMYIQGGYNVYPVEVENVLGAHPEVAMAAGIGVPDPVLGEVGRYYVVPAPGAHPTAGDLAAWCRERLADYKVPRELVFAEQLPLTPAGKVQKAALRETAARDNAERV